MIKEALSLKSQNCGSQGTFEIQEVMLRTDPSCSDEEMTATLTRLQKSATRPIEVRQELLHIQGQTEMTIRESSDHSREESTLGRRKVLSKFSKKGGLPSQANYSSTVTDFDS